MSRRYFKLGATTLIIGGLAHFLLVDLATLWLRTGISSFAPHADLLDRAKETTLNFGPLGSTNFFRATAGFSFWTALSLMFLGVVYLAISGQPEARLRPFVWLGAIISGSFFAVSAFGFIYPATVGAALAFALFVTASIKGES